MTDNSGSAHNGDSLVSQIVSDPSLGARRRTAAAGTSLHEPGEPAGNVFAIHTGQVRLYQLSPDGSRRLMDILGPGQWFGAEAVGGLSQYGCQARTETAATFCMLPATRLLAALEHRPEASLEIIRQLAGRLNRVSEEAGGLAFEDCRHRLIRALVRFSRSAAAVATQDGVELHMTHEQLAQAVGAARETVSLILTDLRQQNLIRTGRNRLSFDPRKLDEALEENHPSSSSTILS